MDTDPENPAFARQMARLDIASTLTDVRAVEEGLLRASKLLDRAWERLAAERDPGQGT
jgi:hypothetical protein